MKNGDLQAFHKTVANAGTLMGFKPVDFIAALITIATAYAESIGMPKEALFDVIRNVGKKGKACDQASEESSTTLT